MPASLLSLIHDRLHKRNQNFIAIMVGPTGSGKSLSSVALAEKLDPTFNIDRIVFEAEEFITLINEGNLKPGSFIVWDEAGAGIAAREAMTKKNIHSGKIAQTFRNRRFGLFLTVPSLSMVDSQFRSLAHYLFKPVRINRTTHKCLINVKQIQHNEQLKRNYFKKQDIKDGNHSCTVIGIDVPLPSRQLRRAYEAKKDAFQHQLYLKHINPIKKKTETKKFDLDAAVKKVIKEKDRFVKQRGTKRFVDKRLVESAFGVGRHRSFRIKRLAEEALGIGWIY